MQVNCQKCSFLQDVVNMSSVNYCQICNSLIYKPDEIFVQQIISAKKREEKIKQNYLQAYTEIPQVFTPTNMIHITAKINNVPVKFLIDTGAQSSILPLSVPTACGLEDLIDEKYSGVLRGVGTDRIMGRIHYLELTFSCGVYPGSFTICKNDKLEPILGIDMMQSLGLKLDFVKRVLIIGNNEIKFEN